MKRKNYIKEISDVFQIPPSSLRYWENESLIKFPRNEKNNYRFLSFQTMIDICDIIFYRDLSIPLKEIKLIPCMDIDELDSTLNKNKERLGKEFYKIKKTIEKIESKEIIIEKVKYLKSSHSYIEKQILAPIKLFDDSMSHENKELIQLYLSNPNEFAIVIDSKTSDAHYGYFTSETDKDIFREKDSCEKTYLRGLLKVEYDNMINNNYIELISNANSLGYKTGLVMGRYLITACEDKRYDYYEAWIELI